MDKSRQQFEAMAVKRGLSTDKKKDCWGQEKYKYDMIQIMWEGWQASRESLEVELPEPFLANESWCYDEDLVNQVLISNGVKIKSE